MGDVHLADPVSVDLLLTAGCTCQQRTEAHSRACLNFVLVPCHLATATRVETLRTSTRSADLFVRAHQPLS